MKQPPGEIVRHSILQGRWFEPPVDEAGDSSSPNDQQRSVFVFTENSNTACRVWNRIEFRVARLPSPESVRYSRPEIAFPILIEARSAAAAGTVLRAGDATSLNSAEPPGGYPDRTRPDRALAVLEKCRHLVARELRILRELARLPAREAGVGANPQRSVARREQRVNRARSESL